MKNKRFVKLICSIMAIFLITGCSDFVDNIFGDGTSDNIQDGWNNFSDNVVDFFTKAGTKIKEYSEPIIDKAKEGISYAYNSVVSFAQDAYENIKTKAIEIAGNTEKYFAGTNPNELAYYEVKYSEEVNPLIKDRNIDFSDPQAFNHIDYYDEELEQFIPYYVSTILNSYGYHTYSGIAFQKGTYYSGLIFTNDDTFIEYEKEKTPTCGFIQIKLDKQDVSILNLDVIEAGLLAIPNQGAGAKYNAYVVTDYADIDPQAGIYKNKYFEFDVSNSYCLNVIVKDSLPSNYQSYPYEIYDFDNQKLLKEKIRISKREELYKLAKTNQKVIASSIEMTNAIADIQEGLSSEDKITNIITINPDSLKDTTSNNYLKQVNDFTELYTDKNDNDEIKVFNASKNEEVDVYNDADLSTNIISLASNTLSLVGSVISVVIGVVAGTPVIKAVVLVSGTSAIIYNVSNIIEDVTDIYYGVPKGQADGANPVYQAFLSAIKDEKLAKIIYHAWGIGSGVITGLTTGPILKAINISRMSGLGTFRTCINVIRAVLTTIAKGATAIIGGMLVGNIVNKIVTYVTDSRFIGNIIGFASTLIISTLIFKGLDNIDQKLNISGLYPKNEALTSFKADYKNYQDEYTFDSQSNDSFANYSRADKEYYAREIRDYVASDLGLQDPPKIEYIYDYNNASSCGYYSNSSNTLTINMASSEHRTWSGIIDTIAHECRHAYQYQFALDNPNSQMAYSLNNYITPDQSYTSYRTQLCEADAFEYGDYFARLFMGLFHII